GGGAGPMAVWVGARDTPNRLLVWNDGAQRFEDRAAERGLDRSGASTAAFFDTDGDGLDDLVYVAERAVERLPGRPDGGFGGPERLAPLPAVGPPAGVIDPARLRPVDLDRDGDLDLLLLAWGTPPRTRVFRRIGAGFADVTADLGVEGLAAGRAAVVADLDLDGFPDVVQLGARAALWHNRAGERFEVRPLPPSVVPPGTTAATVLDADGDRAPDVLAVGHRVRLLWNRSEHTHHAVRVELPAHRVGALVTAEYRDGTRQAQRFGSEHSTAFSQALQPLLFGASDANPVEAIVVRVPGGGAERTALAGRREISLPTP
ncbi:MAG: FG-GAP repeat domain-containing protein, partial [Myxococcota bacterium]